MEPEESKDRMDDDRFLNLDEMLQSVFGENSRPSKRWVRQATSNGLITYYKKGRRVWFKRADVIADFERHRVRKQK